MATRIININDVDLLPHPAALAPKGPAAERYEARMGFIGARLGAQKLGYNVTAIAPGKRAFPLHNHRFAEEMFFVLEGSGEVRIGSESYPVCAGDVVACPAGDRDTAHQFINTGNTDLKFLAVSTKPPTDVVEYPDTGKFGVLAELPSADGKPQTFRFVGKETLNVDYWEGE